MPVINEKLLADSTSWVDDAEFLTSNHYHLASSIGTFPSRLTGLISSHKSSLVIASLNINTLSVAKLTYVLDRMLLHDIDIVCLQDTRHLSDSTSLYKLSFSNYFKSYAPSTEGLGGVLLSYPVNSSRSPGGHMILCRATWGRLLSNWSQDSSGLGLSMWADFSFSGKSLRILSTYWPSSSDDKHSGSLFTRIKTYAHTHSISGSPLAISQHILGKAILPYSEPGKSCILCGDFNSSWNTKKTDRQLPEWASSLGLEHFLHQSRPPKARQVHTFSTRRQGKDVFSHIDHVLHRPTSFTTPTFSVTLSGGDHAINSDHSLLLQGFDIGPTYNPLETALHYTLPPDINLKDKSLLASLAQFQTNLLLSLPPPSTLTPSQASDSLLHFQNEIVSFIRRTRPPHSQFRSRYKNNWSPIFAATAKHISFLLEVRRHCTGQKRRFRWTSANDSNQGLKDLTVKWAASVVSLNPDDQSFVDSLTSRPRSYWSSTTLTSIPRILRFVELDIKTLRSEASNLNIRYFKT